MDMPPKWVDERISEGDCVEEKTSTKIGARAGEEIGLLPVSTRLNCRQRRPGNLLYQHMAEFVEVVFSQFEAAERPSKSWVGEIARSERESEASCMTNACFRYYLEQRCG
jgi:hypothetical protein